MKPDLTLVDIEAHPYVLAAIAAKTRVALINVFFELWKRPGAPPLHLAVTPGTGWRGTRLGLEWTWATYRCSKWWHQQVIRAASGGTGRRSLLRGYAKHIDVDLRRHTDATQWLVPWVYPGLDELTLNLVELELPHEPQPSSHYVGPVLNLERAGLGFDETRDERLAELIARHQQSHGAGKLVYCSFGSHFKGDDRDFMERLIAGVGERPDWDIVIALGGRPLRERDEPLPRNVHCVDWAPQPLILSVADCAVIHGGMTSVYECVHFGVPMVVYPFAVNDQQGTAVRVAHHEVGVVGDRDLDTPSDITTRIESTMADDAVRRRVDEMRNRLRDSNRSERLERAVERLIAGP